jgi:hypothetical protein
MTDISYPESYERTPIFALPFPHPKWHVKAGSKEVYEVTSPIWEEYDAEVGYVDSVGEVRESVEGNEDKSLKQDVRRGKRRLDDVCEMDDENVKRKKCRDEQRVDKPLRRVSRLESRGPSSQSKRQNE